MASRARPFRLGDRRYRVKGSLGSGDAAPCDSARTSPAGQSITTIFRQFGAGRRGPRPARGLPVSSPENTLSESPKARVRGGPFRDARQNPVGPADGGTMAGRTLRVPSLVRGLAPPCALAVVSLERLGRPRCRRLRSLRCRPSRFLSSLSAAWRASTARGRNGAEMGGRQLPPLWPEARIAGRRR